ncbi:MAG TPA: sigma-70 family RNA polymerase sigma factor [Solibacterales bacterium]|nr:sigma-70 family RNA polymerase sigma factor [Bryobacterales bacterium]
MEDVIAAAAGLMKGRVEPLDFEILVNRYERPVLRTAWRLLGNLEDAQDAAQEVFLRLHRNLRQFESAEAAGPWIYRVTVNVCYDLGRKRRRFVPLADGFDPPDVASAADQRLEAEQRRRAVMQGLARLPERERAAVVLREIEGLTTQEVAAIMGITEDTVRSQVASGRGKLRKFAERLWRRS